MSVNSNIPAQRDEDTDVAKLLGYLNGGAMSLMISVGHRTGLFDTMSSGAHATSAQIAACSGLAERFAALLARAASPDNLAVTAQWIGLLGVAEDTVVDSFRHGRGVPYRRYRRFHRSRFTGVDISREAIAAATRKAQTGAVRNITLKHVDAASLQENGCFDLVTAFDAIHEQAKPGAVLKNIRRALRPGGWFLMQDIKARTSVNDNAGNPLAPFLYTVSCMHCMSISLAGGSPGLGAAWGREMALEMLADAGFDKVRVEELPHDMINYYYLSRGN